MYSVISAIGEPGPHRFSSHQTVASMPGPSEFTPTTGMPPASAWPYAPAAAPGSSVQLAMPSWPWVTIVAMSATCLSGDRLASIELASQPSSPAPPSNPSTISCCPGCAPTGFEYATLVVSAVDPRSPSPPQAAIANVATSVAVVADALHHDGRPIRRSRTTPSPTAEIRITPLTVPCQNEETPESVSPFWTTPRNTTPMSVPSTPPSPPV